MNNFGFITVAAAIPSVRVADVDYNVAQTKKLISQAVEHDVEIICFPELGITGYTCGDLFADNLLLDKAVEGLQSIVEYTRNVDIIVVVGLPVRKDFSLYNCAAVISRGEVKGIVPKTYLPNYKEFYEQRWFTSSEEPQIFITPSGVKFGVEICEDLWVPMSPSNNLVAQGADIIFNLSATDELVGKHAYLEQLLSIQSAKLICGYVYSSCGFGESTQDVVYGGNAMIYENGKCLCSAERFAIEPQLQISEIDVEKLRSERRRMTTFQLSKHNESLLSDCQAGEGFQNCDESPRGEERDTLSLRSIEFSSFKRTFDPLPFIPHGDGIYANCEEILNIQTMGLAKRLDHISCKTVVIGISGGLDSTLALLVSVRAFDKLGLDRKGIVGVTMPGFGTTGRTHDNALSLMASLGVTTKEVSISNAVMAHFKDICQDPDVHDITYENCQARERTQILMDLSNRLGGIVVGTGDLSELALGWATYNGDHMSMYGVNASVPKTLIRHLVRYIADTYVDDVSRSTLLDIIDTPISPELIPSDENDGNDKLKSEIAQKTEDLVGPYELHDFFLYHYLRFGFRPAKLYLMACRAFDGSDPRAGIYDGETIKHWLRIFFHRFFAQQFKRSCMPDGPKVGSVSLSPRGDWRMPSDATATLWLEECDKL